MVTPPRPFVGRERELAELLAALGESRHGAGGLWLVGGEPGIGKSRLANEVAREAEQQGMLVLTGHCWEAGGAPAFWPWVQVLRALLRQVGTTEPVERLGARAAHLVTLLPELAQPMARTEALPALDPEQARFQVLEAVAALLVACADRAPLLVVLEDLHAADASSVLLLDFLARELPRTPILVLGTYRTGELDALSAGPYLARVARAARHVDLVRLGREQVGALLERTLGVGVRADLAAAVEAVTEGNPLFVVEMARLLASDPGVGERLRSVTGLPLPPTIRAALRERIARLAPDAREVLRVAAVLGRDFTAAALAELLERPPADLAAHLERAVDAALVARPALDSFRFTHILIREVLHDELPDERRWALHERRAGMLAKLATTGVAPAWSEIAHHWLQAGPAARGEAEAALVRAAEQATERMAFDDAALALERALACLDVGGRKASLRRFDVVLALGHARNLAGDVAAAREACSAAARLARSLGDGERLARAALEYGAVFVYGNVDPHLVLLLEEALRAMPPADGPMRARLMARLAAARQPAFDPEEPVPLARAAIAMARRVSTPEMLLATLRDACGGLMDVVEPAERLAINREHVELAERLGDPREAWRGTMRIVFDGFEMGDVRTAHAAVEVAERLAERLAHPHYRWQVAGLRAMCAVREGRFVDARRHLADARALAEGARDPNARRALLIHEMCRLRVEGRDDEVRARLPELAEQLQGYWFGESLARIWACVAGYGPELCGAMGRAEIEHGLASVDSSLIRLLTEIAILRGDQPLMASISERLGRRAKRTVSWGIFGLSVEGPVTHLLGRLALARGRASEARELLGDALERARAMGARPHVAWIAYHLAGTWSGDALHDGASAALAFATKPGMSSSRASASASTSSSRGSCRPASEPPALRIRMTLDGELWVVEGGAARFHLRDSRGLHMLATLLSRPGQDWHVLDLSTPDGSRSVAQRDTGEVLDARARAEYRERLGALRADIEEAESWNDAARAERGRAELEALTAELERAMGLGGRARRTGGDAERARVNVQRRVRGAIRRIAEHDSPMARHLERSIRTGTLCRYDPE